MNIYEIFSLISTLGSLIYAIWEYKKVQRNKALIYELQQLSINNYYTVNLVYIILKQNNIDVKDFDQITKDIPPEVFREMAEYKINISCIKKPQ